MSADKAPSTSYLVWDPSICKTTPDYKTGKVSADTNYGFDGKKRKERGKPEMSFDYISN